MKEPVTTWFTDEREFRQLCGDAQSQARSESAQNFTADVMIQVNKSGLAMSLSQKQIEWLCQIADWEVPPRRSF